MEKENKVKTSFTLSPMINTTIESLSKKLEISKTAIITLAVLEFAKIHRVDSDTSTQDKIETN